MARKRTNADITRDDLLLTLDYLLENTDEFHPATQQDILDYAQTYGLKYDKNNPEGPGNDVKRQRIGQCLKYLKNTCDKFPDAFPFVLAVTDGGKYYIESKCYLDEEQIVKILTAVKTDKYIKEKDAEILINSLLDLFCNANNRKSVEQKVNSLSKRVKKFSPKTNAKIEIIYEAFQEKKSVRLSKYRYGRMDEKTVPAKYRTSDTKSGIYYGTFEEEIWCRVYQIQEFKNKPFAILIPLNKSGVICEAIEDLEIKYSKSKSEVFMEDDDYDDRLNKLFIRNNGYLASRYGSLDSYVNDSVLPNGYRAIPIAFYFYYGNADRIKKSFEEYFSTTLDIIPCESYELIRENMIQYKVDLPRLERYIGIRPFVSADTNEPKYGLANIRINYDAFVQWLLENPAIEELVIVGAPERINEALAEQYIHKLRKYRSTRAFERGIITELCLKPVSFNELMEYKKAKKREH